MFLKIVIWLLLPRIAVSGEDGFTFNGFIGASLVRDGTAVVTPEGLLRLTNSTKETKGHAIYPTPLDFRRSPTSNILSFSTTFVFGIIPENDASSSHGVAFFISPSNDFSKAQGDQYLGLLNASNNGDPSNHIIAVELDTVQNLEFEDIDDNHVGINVNSLRSNTSSGARYFTGKEDEFEDLCLFSGDPMQVWIDFDGIKMELNVTLAPLGISKPHLPLFSPSIDLSSIMSDPMYVGFSASQGAAPTSHYILGWSLKIDGTAEALNLSRLPSLPLQRSLEKKKASWRIWFITASLCLLASMAVALASFMAMRKMKFAELVEDWELQYGPQRFCYKDLFMATKGFTDKQLLGSGGFGKVYKGILSPSNIEVAVKRVSHQSRQGMKEFIAEIVSIGQVRHRNLVQLLGYCRRKGELLLVYDFMPMGSLDKLLFNQEVCVLDWGQRLQIIKGVASGILYLHQGWEKVVIHRDIKASNVLLDVELNGKLGDFGLARLYDHGTDPHTTHVVGTMGYLAPELTRTGKATTSTDVFAFGAFLLEIASGRRPIEPKAKEEEAVLVDWVVANLKRGAILESCDQRLEGKCQAEEMELVLKLGLLCCHPLPAARPGMRQVMQILDGHVPLPEFSPDDLNDDFIDLLTDEEGFDGNTGAYPSYDSSIFSGRS